MADYFHTRMGTELRASTFATRLPKSSSDNPRLPYEPMTNRLHASSRAADDDAVGCVLVHDMHSTAILPLSLGKLAHPTKNALGRGFCAGVIVHDRIVSPAPGQRGKRDRLRLRHGYCRGVGSQQLRQGQVSLDGLGGWLGFLLVSRLALLVDRLRFVLVDWLGIGR